MVPVRCPQESDVNWCAVVVTAEVSPELHDHLVRRGKESTRGQGIRLSNVIDDIAVVRDKDEAVACFPVGDQVSHRDISDH
ncbi:hypothetical protein D3C73_1149910 [compost metagenome]